LSELEVATTSSPSSLPGEPPRDVPAIVQNWWLWCKPGDLIAIDEAQFVAPRGTMGRKPPYWIQCMEIHRHYGVDFLIVTQHPGLIDTTIRALVGMHRHVRSVLGSPLCMVYVWDHASNPERYSLANKEKFIRRAKHYKLFHSSVAHIKPPTSGRSALAIAGLLMCLGVAGFWHKIGGMINAKASPATNAQASPSAQRAMAAAPALAEAPKRPAGFVDVPQLAGCWAQGNTCACIDRAGRRVQVSLDMCRLSSSSYDGLVAWEPRPAIKGEGYGAAAQAGGAASSPVAKVL